MERKKIIIDEIKYWKNSRLLPEQYCNFLLSLYTEGEETGHIDKQQPRKSFQKNVLPIIVTIFGLALFGLTFLVIYFTEISPFLQTGFVIFLSGFMFLIARQIKHLDNRIIHLYNLLAALIMFLGTIHLVSFLFPNMPNAVMATVIVTCLIWIIIGVKYKLKYFLFSGALGLFVAIYFLFR